MGAASTGGGIVGIGGDGVVIGTGSGGGIPGGIGLVGGGGAGIGGADGSGWSCGGAFAPGSCYRAWSWCSMRPSR